MHGSTFGLHTTNFICHQTSECTYGKAHADRRREISLLLWRGDESKICKINRMLILPEQRWFKQKVSIASCPGYLTPDLFLVYLFKLIVALSTTSVTALSIYNPPNLWEKLQGVEQQWFLQRTSGIVLGYIPNRTEKLWKAHPWKCSGQVR